jgi:hypothetical protein
MVLVEGSSAALPPDFPTKHKFHTSLIVSSAYCQQHFGFRSKFELYLLSIFSPECNRSWINTIFSVKIGKPSPSPQK